MSRFGLRQSPGPFPVGPRNKTITESLDQLILQLEEDENPEGGGAFGGGGGGWVFSVTRLPSQLVGAPEDCAHPTDDHHVRAQREDREG